MEIKALVEKSHSIARAKGWWKDKRTYPEAIMMIITELSESVQEDRNSNIEGRNEEIADVFIRLCDLVGYLKIDIEETIERKMKINEGRPYKHGKLY